MWDYIWLYKIIKVLWLGSNDDVTWESESSVTKKMVEDYKQQINDDSGTNKDHSVKRRREDAEDEVIQG